ncbi:MAG: hypothetical protein HS101_02430 [Planctomycetia bacterium]|nr:hypothetical protein [Planctomycetia bacterium]
MKLANSACSFAIAATLCVIPGSLAVAQSGGDDFANLEPGWLESWQSEIDRQVDWFTSAYELTPDEIATLRVELTARVHQQHEYDEKMKTELSEMARKIENSGVSLDDESSPEVQALASKFFSLTQSMPLNDEEVSAWLGSRITQERAAEGRIRLQELQAQAQSEIIVAKGDQELASGKKGILGKEAVAMTSQIDPAYNRPVPASDLGERVEAQDRLDRLARNIEPTRGRLPDRPNLQSSVPQVVPPPVVHQIDQQRHKGASATADPATPTPALPGPPRPVVSNPGADVSRAAPQNAKPEPPPQPAPPLDDWEKYVLSTADKYGFNDAQLTNARSILSDLRRRAYQYQASRAEAFARAELMTDVKAREAEKTVLNRPLDALFAELKVRLDSLPTQSQRQKAGSTPAKR